MINYKHLLIGVLICIGMLLPTVKSMAQEEGQRGEEELIDPSPVTVMI